MPDEPESPPDPQPVPADSIFAPQGIGPQREARARLVVVGQVHHQQAGEDATSVELAHVRFLQTVEQPVRRRVEVGEEWQPIFRGWLDAASAVVIHNHEGERRQRIPTEAELAESAGRVVEVRFGSATGIDSVPHVLCRPGESSGPFEPGNLLAVFLRCRRGRAKITVDLIPE